MADAYSGWSNHPGGGTTYRMRSYVNAFVSREDGDSAWITVQGHVAVDRAALYGVVSQVGHAGGGGLGSQWNDDGRGVAQIGANVAGCSREYGPFAKSLGAYAVRCWCKAWGETVDGYGAWDGPAMEAYVDVSVAARTFVDFGAPSISVSKATVGMGESVTVSWAKSPTQGNAGFAYFEVYENGSKVYSGSGTSVARTPSDVPDVGSVVYEVREVHEWYGTYPYKSASASVAVVRLARPNPPALTAPQDGSAHDSAGTVALRWKHNPTDRTEQTAAEVGVSTDSRTWDVKGVEGAAQSYPLALPGYSGKAVYWRVRTKGGHADWSEWSQAGYFRAYPRPAVSLDVPPRLESYPFRVSWGFSDAYGSQASATLTLRRQGVPLKAYALTNQSFVDVQPGDAALSQGDVVDAVLEAASTTGLAAQAAGSFAVDYLPPARPQLALSVDRDRLSVGLRAFFGVEPGAAPTAAVDVYRGGVLVASGLSDGEACSDALPPLDVPVEYRAVARALSGSESSLSASAVVDSRGCVAVNFGEGYGDVALVGLNGRPSVKVERDKDEFEAAAYAAPVVAYGTHVRASGSVSGTVARSLRGYGSLGALLRLMDWGRACVVRLPLVGRRYHADVAASVGGYAPRTAEASIDWKETAHDGDL